MDTPSCFPTTFTKGNNFCDFRFASLDDKSLQLGLSIKKEFAPRGPNSFLEEKGHHNKSVRVAFPESEHTEKISGQID